MNLSRSFYLFFPLLDLPYVNYIVCLHTFKALRFQNFSYNVRAFEFLAGGSVFIIIDKFYTYHTISFCSLVGDADLSRFYLTFRCILGIYFFICLCLLF